MRRMRSKWLVAAATAGLIACVGIACTEDGDDGTGPGPIGKTIPTEADLQGNWYGLNYMVDMEYEMAETVAVADSTWLVEGTSDQIIWLEMDDQSGDCYCMDTSDYTGFSGDTILGEEFTGLYSSAGMAMQYTTTARMRGAQLVITYTAVSSGTFQIPGMVSYTSDTTYVSEAVYDPFTGSVPPAGVGECPDCDILWKQAARDGRTSPSLRKGTASGDVVGTWIAVEYIEQMQVTMSVSVASDTMVTVRFTPDSAIVYEKEYSPAPTCHSVQGDTLGLLDSILQGDAFTGAMLVTGEEADWWTSLVMSGDTLTLTSEVTGSSMEVSSGESSSESARMFRQADLLPTSDNVPPASWPTDECSDVWWEEW